MKEPNDRLGRALLVGFVPAGVVVLALAVLAFRWPSPALVAQGVADRLAEAASPGTKLELADLRDRIDRLTDQIVKFRPITDRELKTQLEQSRIETVKLLLAKMPPAPAGGDEKLAAIEKKLDAVQKRLDGLGEPGPVGPADPGLKAALAEQAKKLDALGARLDRLGEVLRVPGDDQLVPVLFVFECGQSMEKYAYETARAAVLDALAAAVEQTPQRHVGLLAARGKEVATLLPLRRNYAADVAAVRGRPDDLQPVRGQEVAWQPACDKALNVLAPRDDRRQRVVYVTCAQPADATLDAGKLASDALKRGIEIWVVQPTRGGGDGPAKELAQLATDTGGQFVLVNAARDNGPRQALAARRLAAVLHNALDLRATER